MPQPSAKSNFTYKPLYIQVKEGLVGYLIDGTWQPGQLIPSEIELARQTGVSQGTVRKALDAMTAEHLLIRRQGRGTYVAVPEESQILFRYYRMRPDRGEHSFPTSTILSSNVQKANDLECRALNLNTGDDIICILRIRKIGGTPILTETIALPVSRFDGFAELDVIPNNVYQLYSERWGITVARASERLKAVLSNASDAGLLGCETAAPLLQISRVAYDLEDKPVELRLSRCLTDQFHYQVDLN